jgi:hypothetical protein
MQTFIELQQEVLRRATRDQGGTQFTTASKNVINSSLFRIARDAPWRQMRRNATVTTKTDYVTGTNYGYATLTSGSNIVGITNGRLLQDNIEINRRIKFSDSSTYYYIRNIISDTQMVIDKTWVSATTTTSNYGILPQMEYNLPIQSGTRTFLWHEDYGFPTKMTYITDQMFYEISYFLTIKNVPLYYRMWGEDMSIKQLTTSSNLTFSSSSTSDTSQKVTVFGVVDGFPVSETISLNGTTTVTSTNKFTKIERVAKNDSTLGRVTVTGNSGWTNVAIIPQGDATAGILYKKIQIYPLPVRSFDINVSYYKDPFRLVGDGDIHELGQEFDEAIILLSVSKLKGETEQAGAGSFYSMWQEEMRSLRRVNCDKIDWKPGLRKPFSKSSGLVANTGLLYNQVGSSGSFGPASRH